MGIINVVATVKVKPIANGWLYQSGVAKLHKLMTVAEIERNWS